MSTTRGPAQKEARAGQGQEQSGPQQVLCALPPTIFHQAQPISPLSHCPTCGLPSENAGSRSRILSSSQSLTSGMCLVCVCVCVCVRARAEKGMKTTPPLYMTPASIIDIVSAVLDFTHLLISLHHCLSNLCVTFNSKKILKDNTLDKCTCGYNGRPQPHNCLKVWGSIALEEYNMSHMYN